MRSDNAPDPRRKSTADADYDAIIIGAGHNGLITAAYLAKAGLRTLLLEARATVGGTASTEPFGGGLVNICNCDHLTFRTTPIADELDLARHGLVYDDLDPAQFLVPWGQEGPAIRQHRDLDATLESIAAVAPRDVDGYRRFVHDAEPIIRLIFDAAIEPPTRSSLLRVAMQRRFAGLPRLVAWSRRSAADVIGSYVASPAVAATGMVGGPMVWGVSPTLAGTGLGALPHPMRHLATLGRPRGGSGALTESIAAAFTGYGGEMRTSTAVVAIDCDRARVRGVTLFDGTQVTGRVVISAADPRRTLVRWVRNPPPAALAMIGRWRSQPVHEGYESKIDAIVTEAPVISRIGEPNAATAVIAPTIAEMDRGWTAMSTGTMMQRPAMLCNVPTVIDPSMAPPGTDHHVLSIEVLYTPYQLDGAPGGSAWASSSEPSRWVELFDSLCDNDVQGSILDWRAMTPDVYETDFHLPAGHATSFGGGPVAVFANRSPELTGYETDIPGLFLTGAATFPGAGVWGASGRNCAAVVTERLAAS